MKIPKKPVDPAQAYSGFGKTMMEKMGWKSGGGLGKEGQGMSEHIEVVKKDDQQGVGANDRYAWEDKWWEGVYNSSSKLDKLAALQGDSVESSDSDDGVNVKNTKKGSKPKRIGEGKKKSNPKSESDSDDSDSDDEVEDGRDGITCTATKAERAIAKQLAQDGWGRWGGREGKMSRIRAAEASFQAEKGPAAAGVPAVQKDGEMRKKGRKNSKEEKVKKKRKSAEPETASTKKTVILAAVQAEEVASKKRRKEAQSCDSLKEVIVDGGIPEGEPSRGLGCSSSAIKGGVAKLKEEEEEQILEGKKWWGAGIFISAGVLKSRDEEKEDVKKSRGFDEEDQVNLYDLAHSGKTSGKQGLGTRSKNKLGMDFRGKKIAFAAEVEAEDTTLVPEEAGEKSAKVKWKKLIKAVLEEAGGELKVRKLQKKVLAMACAEPGTEASTELLKVQFAKQLKKGFLVTGDIASLADATEIVPQTVQVEDDITELKKKKKKKKKKRNDQKTLED